MAIIIKNDFKQMNEAQIGEKLSGLKKELMKIKTQISTGTVPENPGRVSEVKKTIARIITVLSLKNKQKLEKKEEKTVKQKPAKEEEKTVKKTEKKYKEENKNQ